MKVVDKINAGLAEGKIVFSFEYFPPKTEEGVENLLERMDRMVSHHPAFCDITWGAGGSTADVTLDVATKMQNLICIETMMHLTCTNMPVAKLDETLVKVKAAGIQNILALRGDPPHGQEKFVATEGGFSCALDLVKYIKEKHGDDFGITVSGYPEAHPDAINGADGATEEEYRKDLEYLKQKIDAGGEVIVTQLFYDTDIFLKFVNDCRNIGIKCPIVPGIMPINAYGGFKRMTGFCKTKVPAEITEALEAIKDNDEAVKAYGIHLGTEMCKKILAHGIRNLHLYTLNLEKSAVAILQNLGIIDESNVPRTLPWRPALTSKRTSEEVRPIFWANRPKSYLSRTLDWDEYPRGRWGDSRSPAYGTLSDYQFLRRRSKNKKVQAEWAVSIATEADVHKLFAKYCNGEMTSNPWSEVEGLHPETARINEKLVDLNQRGFLTINSQPSVNGLPSSDKEVGWGGPNGRVYQKAYLEFFVSPEKLESLIEKIKRFPLVTYIAVNKSGEVKSNVSMQDVNAVTWGVFPAKEVIQPTVVDPTSFLVWKDEAFDAWTVEWADLYPEGDPARDLLAKFRDTHFLVSVVDNNYVDGELFTVFEGL